MIRLVLKLTHWQRRLPAALAAAALMPAPVSAAILWSHPQSIQVCTNGLGDDILKGAVSAQDESSDRAFYFKFRALPFSDAATEATSRYFAGFMLYDRGEEHLGVGNAWKSWGYSAFNVSGRGEVNDVDGEYNLNSGNPEGYTGKSFEYVRRGVSRVLVFKVQLVPDEDARVTVWLNPNLSPGATEFNQRPGLVTQLRAKATFDEVRLRHAGGGDGWEMSELAVATSFEDFVPKPFWQSGWFITVTAGGLILAVATGVGVMERRRARLRIRILEREHAVAMERARIARDIHDELGAGLAQIGLLADVGSGESANLTEAGKNFSLIAQRARSVVAGLDEIVWAVDPQNDNLTRLADYLCQMADEYFQGGAVACRKNVPTSLPPFPIRAEVRHDLTLAVREAFANLLKHSSATEAKLEVAWNEPELVITVSDNGRGFDPAKADNGNGLGNQRGRLERNGGKLTVQSAPGRGTQVIFRVSLVKPD